MIKKLLRNERGGVLIELAISSYVLMFFLVFVCAIGIHFMQSLYFDSVVNQASTVAGITKINYVSAADGSSGSYDTTTYENKVKDYITTNLGPAFQVGGNNMKITIDGFDKTNPSFGDSVCVTVSARINELTPQLRKPDGYGELQSKSCKMLSVQ